VFSMNFIMRSAVITQLKIPFWEYDKIELIYIT
jgi:hypothetical protein